MNKTTRHTSATLFAPNHQPGAIQRQTPPNCLGVDDTTYRMVQPGDPSVEFHAGMLWASPSMPPWYGMSVPARPLQPATVDRIHAARAQYTEPVDADEPDERPIREQYAAELREDPFYLPGVDDYER